MGTTDRRVVSSSLEWRMDGDSLVAEGYASTFNQPYDMGWYVESVRSGAFRKTLSETPDVRYLINHDDLPLARTTAGSLDLAEDSHGLFTRARFNPADPDVQRLKIKSDDGLVDRMSFGFRTIRDEWDSDYENRELVELSLADGDVSAVTYPANPNTSMTIRSLDTNPEDVRAVYRMLREADFEEQHDEYTKVQRRSLIRALETRNAMRDASEELEGMFVALRGAPAEESNTAPYRGPEYVEALRALNTLINP